MKSLKNIFFRDVLGLSPPKRADSKRNGGDFAPQNQPQFRKKGSFRNAKAMVISMDEIGKESVKNAKIGINIKTARKKLCMTQSDLSDGIITRNMLSQIEGGKAVPSVPVLMALSEKLGVSCDYLLYGTPDDADRGMLDGKMPGFREMFEKGKYSKLIKASERFLPLGNFELELMIADSHLALAKACFNCGDLSECLNHLSLADEIFGKRGIKFPKSYITLYTSLAQSLQEGKMPSAFDGFGDERMLPESIAYFLIINLIDKGMSDRAAVLYDTMKFSFEPMRYHINSRLAASKCNFERAKELLAEIISEKQDLIPTPFMLLFYSELEDYCARTGDYKGAYEAVREKEQFIKNIKSVH